MARAWLHLDDHDDIYPPKRNILLYFAMTIGVIGVAYGLGSILNKIMEKNIR